MPEKFILFQSCQQRKRKGKEKEKKILGECVPRLPAISAWRAGRIFQYTGNIDPREVRLHRHGGKVGKYLS
jgi:hypothetical protein